MPRSWPGYLPSMLAAPVTLILGAVYAAAVSGSEPAGPLRGVALLLLIPVPLGVSVIWGHVLLASRPLPAAIAGAAAWLALSHLLFF